MSFVLRRGSRQSCILLICQVEVDASAPYSNSMVQGLLTREIFQTSSTFGEFDYFFGCRESELAWKRSLQISF